MTHTICVLDLRELFTSCSMTYSGGNGIFPCAHSLREKEKVGWNLENAWIYIFLREKIPLAETIRKIAFFSLSFLSYIPHIKYMQTIWIYFLTSPKVYHRKKNGKRKMKLGIHRLCFSIIFRYFITDFSEILEANVVSYFLKSCVRVFSNHMISKYIMTKH